MTETTEDLVKRLRRVSMDLGIPSTTTLDSKVVAQAADRIEALEAKLAKAVEALEHLEKQSSATSARGAVTGPHWMKLSIAILTARAALAELKGEK